MDQGSPRADLHIGDWVECCLADRHGHHNLRGEVIEISGAGLDVLLEDGHHWRDRLTSGFVTSLERYLQLARRLRVTADDSDDALLRAARHEGVILELEEAPQLRAALEQLALRAAA